MTLQCSLHGVVLTTYGNENDEQDLVRLEAYKTICLELVPHCNVRIIRDPVCAIDHILADGLGGELHVYATGSLRLVAPVLKRLSGVGAENTSVDSDGHGGHRA